MKMLAAFLLILGLGIGAAYQVTDRFQALTTEDARRLAIAAHPRRIPDAAVQYPSGRDQLLSAALASDGRVTIVNFIYTRCNAICSVLGTEFQQLQKTIRADGLTQQVRLLSISFDPLDTPAQLTGYAQRMQAQADIWQFATLHQADQRKAVLDAFGITVIPAPLGEFEHNAAFHIVTPDGRLLRVVDYADAEGALRFAVAASRRPALNPVMTAADIRRSRS